MNKLSSIAQALEMVRQIGKTYQIAQACQNLGATLICANRMQARQIEQQYDIETATIDYELRGLQGPFLIDNYAVSSLLWEALKEIEKAHDEKDKLLVELIKTKNQLYEQTTRPRRPAPRKSSETKSRVKANRKKPTKKAKRAL